MQVMVTLVLALATAPLFVLTLCFAVEIFFGLMPLPAPAALQGQSVTAVIIVPAHNEASILDQKLSSLIEAVGQQARILVVADNCTDRTAEVAKLLGVEVVERFNTKLRGKGFALDFACHHLQGEPPDVVLVIDADCDTDAGSIKSLIATCAATGRPCQSTNLQLAEPGTSPTVQLSTFAFYIKNVVRQRGLVRLSGRAHLFGTGMALPWSVFARAQLATDCIVEDLKLGQALSSAGHEPVFVEDAIIWSKAESGSNTISQRRRWEGGFLQNALRAGPQMLKDSILRGQPRLFWAAVDTMIPPFALLFLLDVSSLLILATWGWLAPISLLPLSFLCVALLTAMFALGLAWYKGGSRFVSSRSLILAPFYVAWKVPMYIGLAKRGAPKEWMRTSRR